eukprot:jgi/Psemu1/6620/gm1.6620_g
MASLNPQAIHPKDQSRNSRNIEAFISYAGGKYGKDVRATLTKMEVTIITAKAPANHDRETIKALTSLRAKNWEFNIKEQPQDPFDKLWAQCDLGMQNKVKSHIRWKSAVKKMGNQSLTEYHHAEFGMLVRMAEQRGNTYSMSDMEELIIRSQTDPKIKEKSMSKLNTDIQEVISQNTQEVYLATIFIMNANDTKYDRPRCMHHAGQLQVQEPRTPVVGHTYLSRGKKEKNEESEGSKLDSSQEDNGVPNRYRNFTCYWCGRKGHIAAICKAIKHIDGTTIQTNNKKENNTKDQGQYTGAIMLIDRSCDSESEDDDTRSDVEDHLDEPDYNYQIGWTNCMKGVTKDRKEVVVEDSTVHMFCQKAFLTNIREATDELHLYANAGMTIITHVGYLPGFGTVWFHPEGIANMLSFDGVAKTKGYMIEYNNLTMGNYFQVTNPSGEIKVFRPSQKGLYYWDSQHIFAGSTRTTIDAVNTMVNTVPSMFNEEGTVLFETIQENKQQISKKDIRRAETARALQHIAGHLNDTQLLKICQKQQLVSSRVTSRDVQLMRAILGPSIPGLKGKTV